MVDTAYKTIAHYLLHKTHAIGKNGGSKKQRSTDVWEIRVETDGTTTRMTRSHGIEGGKMQTVVREYTAGKQGRSGEEQAMLECSDLVQNKIVVKGYAIVQRTDSPLYPAPDAAICHLDPTKPKSEAPVVKTAPPHVMLAQKFEDHSAKYIAPEVAPGHYLFWVMPKLDGVFCLANLRTGALWSRARKPLGSTLVHIEPEVKKLGEGFDASVEWIVGELYMHGMTFQEISGNVRTKSSKTPVVKMEYHVFDAISDLPFSKRRVMLTDRFANWSSPSHLVLVECLKVEDNTGDSKNVTQKIKEMHDMFVGQGYEGAMVHVEPTVEPLVGYQQDTRSKWLLKYKSFMQEEFVCMEIKPQKHNSVVAGSAILKHPDGDRTFSASLAVPLAAKREIWKTRQQYVGAIATVSFFSYTDGGIPRFPQLLGFRHIDDL